MSTAERRVVAADDRPVPVGAARRRQPVSPRPRIRVPEVALGVILVVGFGLAAVVWQSSSSRRVPVVVLASDVRRGEVIGAADLRAEGIGAGADVPLVPWADHGSLVGRVAVADLPAGLPLRPQLVADATELATGEALVALRLTPGSYPAGSLRVGDTVDVVFAPPAGIEPDPAAVTVVAEAASVWDLAELADADGSDLVTLRLSVDAARQVGAVAGSVRLVRVGGEP